MSRRCAEHFSFTGWLTWAFDSVSSIQQQTPHEPENIAIAVTHLPVREDTIVGRNEYNEVVAAVVDLA